MSGTVSFATSSMDPLPYDACPPGAPRLSQSSPPFGACNFPVFPRQVLMDYFANQDPPVPDLILDISSDYDSESDIVVTAESDKENSPPLPTDATVPPAPVMAPLEEIPAAAIAEYDGIVAEDDKGFEGDDEWEEEEDEEDGEDEA